MKLEIVTIKSKQGKKLRLMVSKSDLAKVEGDQLPYVLSQYMVDLVT